MTHKFKKLKASKLAPDTKAPKVKIWMQIFSEYKIQQNKTNKITVSRNLNSWRFSFTVVTLVVLILNGLKESFIKRMKSTNAAVLHHVTSAQLRVKGKRDLVPLPANDDSTHINCRLLKSLVGKGALRQTQTWGISPLVLQWTLWLRCYRLRFKSLISQLSTSQTTQPERSCLIYLETQCVAPFVQFWHNWSFCCCNKWGRVEFKGSFSNNLIPYMYMYV